MLSDVSGIVVAYGGIRDILCHTSVLLQYSKISMVAMGLDFSTGFLLPLLQSSM